jgi:signal transduction histidine kinase
VGALLPPRPAESSSPTDLPGRLHRIPAWVGDIVIALLVIGPALVVWEDGHRGPFSPPALALAITAAAVLPLRRRWPFAVLGATVALFVASAVLGELGPASSLPVAVAVFGMVTRVRRRTSVITTAATIVVLMAAALLSQPTAIMDPRLIQLAAVTGFAAAAADATRSRRAYIAAITERAVRAEQTRESEARRRVAEERLRIARDLHDVVAHQIAVINLQAGVASAAVRSRPGDAEQSLATIRSAARTVLGEIGDLLAMLRGGSEHSGEPALAPLGGMGRLEELLDHFRQTGLDVTHRTEGTAVELPSMTDLVAYRVIQEALTNAHKHGDGHRAHLLIKYSEEAVTITVSNPVSSGQGGPEQGGPGQGGAGRGGPGLGEPGQAGHGLLGIAERVESVRGTVQHSPAGASPFRLEVWLPIPTGSVRDAAVRAVPDGRDGGPA